MATHKDKVYKDKDGLIISASQWRLLERRKMVAKLYKKLLPKYAHFGTLCFDIAREINKSGIKCNVDHVKHDLRVMGFEFRAIKGRPSCLPAIEEACAAE